MLIAAFMFGGLRTAAGGLVCGALAVSVAVLVGLAWHLGRRVGRRSGESDGRRLSQLNEVREEITWNSDAEGRVTYASSQCLELLGYTSDEARSLTLLDVVHPDERAELGQLIADGQGWRRRPFRCIAKDGSPIWLRGSAVVRVDADGRLVGLSGAAHRLFDVPPDEGLGGATSAAVLRAIQSNAVTTAFQPIVSLATGRMLGVEALSRFSIPGEERTPQDWFTDAAKVGLGLELELHVLSLALNAAPVLPDHMYVSVNLSPEALLWPGLADVLARAPIAPSRIVVEITEHASVRDYDRLAAALRPLRDTGIRLAVDDAGAGYASFRHILCLSPEFIKLDRALISGIDSDPAQRALAAAVVMFAADMKATVIAEGVEETAELDIVRSLSIDAGQGYLLGKPTADATDWLNWGKVRIPRPGTPATAAKQ